MGEKTERTWGRRRIYTTLLHPSELTVWIEEGTMCLHVCANEGKCKMDDSVRLFGNLLYHICLKSGFVSTLDL